MDRGEGGAASTLVLLHGAGLGSWIWKDVQPLLRSKPVALDVPGRRPGATPAQCARDLLAEIDRQAPDSVVLVLHSLAGVLAPDLASLLGNRLRRIVHLASVIPAPGRSFVDAIGFPAGCILRLLFRFRREGLRPSPAMIRHELCHDLDERTASLVIERYESEFPGLFLSPTGRIAPGCPTTYIRLSQDRSVPPRRQDRFIARLAAPRIVGIDAGHLAMLSAPARLAELLDREAGE